MLLALLGTALFSEPWITLIVIAVGYVAAIPFSVRSYAKVKAARQVQPN